MIMNYVLSFCKITAASRIFSRNFYLPLLKPLTPKDALRTFKVTGKWVLGSKIQRYIPVLLNHKKKRQKRLKKSKKHYNNSGYTYMIPVIHPTNESHELLFKILKEKDSSHECGSAYVYSVNDRMYNLVLSAEFELAIQDGDIIDIVVSQSNDKILVKLKNMKKVPVDLDVYNGSEILYNGEGCTTMDEEKFHHYGKYTMQLAKVFEAKEQAEEWEIELLKIVGRKKKQRGEGTQEWNTMVDESMQNLDWQKFEDDAKKVVSEIMEPVVEERIPMQIENLNKTKDVKQFLMANADFMMPLLPIMAEIPDIVKNMGDAVYYEVPSQGDSSLKISGVKVVLCSGKECFVPGQMVKGDDGDIFVPGQSIETEFGLEYAPGFTVNLNGDPQLIKGLIMGEDNDKPPMFVPTESTITSDGQLTFITNPTEREKNLKHKKIYLKRRKGKTANVHSTKCESIEDTLNIINCNCENDLNITITAVTGSAGDNKIVQPNFNIDDEIDNEKRRFNLVEYDSNILSNANSLDANELDEHQMKTVEENIKPVDDRINQVIANLEDKKLELERKLEALRKQSVNLENCVTFVNFDQVLTAVKNIIFDQQISERVADILLTLTRRMYSFGQRSDINIKNIDKCQLTAMDTTYSDKNDKYHMLSKKLKITLKSVIYAANEVFKTRPKDQLLALNTMVDLFTNESRDKDLIKELCSSLVTDVDRNDVCSSIIKDLTQQFMESKVDILNEVIKSGIHKLSTDPNDVVENLFKVIYVEGEIFGEVFKKLAKSSPDFVKSIFIEVKNKLDEITIQNDSTAKRVLMECVTSCTRRYAVNNLTRFLSIADQIDLKNLLMEAFGLASTLDLENETAELANLLRKPTNRNTLQYSENVISLLERTTLLRKLCEREYSLKNALERLKKRPQCGRTDPRIRQLLKESALITSQMIPVRSSSEVPLKLFQALNWVAIEDWVLTRSGIENTILVSRRGIQAVIPQDAEKNVLAGRVPYTLINEHGASCFKPIGMFVDTIQNPFDFKVRRNHDMKTSNNLSSVSTARMVA